MIFLLRDPSQRKPLYFLKAYCSGILRGNRLNRLLKNLKSLEELKVPLIKPIHTIFKNPVLSYLRGEFFYGYAVYEYLEKGFLREEDFISSNRPNFALLHELVGFLYELHERGILLRDTKFNNFYYTEEEGFKVFDLDGVEITQRSPSLRERLEDLAPLAMTLEWIGFSEASKEIFRKYQWLYPHLGDEYISYFLKLVNERELKRFKKLRKEKTIENL
ncbi:MAG: hypothetical protein RMI93_00035 [Caldimicrobium sp.]|nr:hypothetical protein [Caldimicrobium sp.]MDW8181985.1 hypothetical protein [Caldimicrobium sp.]